MVIDGCQHRRLIDLGNRHSERRLGSQRTARVVAHRDDHRVGRWTLSFRRSPSDLTRDRIHPHPDRTLHQGIGEIVGRKVGIGAAQCHRPLHALGRRLTAHRGQHRHPVHLGDGEGITAFGRQTGLIRYPHYRSVGIGALRFGGSPGQSPIGGHDQSGRSRDQIVADRLGRDIGIAPTQGLGTGDHFIEGERTQVGQYGRIGHLQHIHGELRFGRCPRTVGSSHLNDLSRRTLEFRGGPFQQAARRDRHPRGAGNQREGGRLCRQIQIDRRQENRQRGSLVVIPVGDRFDVRRHIHLGDRQLECLGIVKHGIPVIFDFDGHRESPWSLGLRRHPTDAACRRHGQPGGPGHQPEGQPVGRDIGIRRLEIEAQSHPLTKTAAGHCTQLRGRVDRRQTDEELVGHSHQAIAHRNPDRVGRRSLFLEWRPRKGIAHHLGSLRSAHQRIGQRLDRHIGIGGHQTERVRRQVGQDHVRETGEHGHLIGLGDRQAETGNGRIHAVRDAQPHRIGGPACRLRRRPTELSRGYDGAHRAVDQCDRQILGRQVRVASDQGQAVFDRFRNAGIDQTHEARCPIGFAHERQGPTFKAHRAAQVQIGDRQAPGPIAHLPIERRESSRSIGRFREHPPIGLHLAAHDARRPLKGVDIACRRRIPKGHIPAVIPETGAIGEGHTDLVQEDRGRRQILVERDHHLRSKTRRG